MSSRAARNYRRVRKLLRTRHTLNPQADYVRPRNSPWVHDSLRALFEVPAEKLTLLSAGAETDASVAEIRQRIADNYVYYRKAIDQHVFFLAEDGQLNPRKDTRTEVFLFSRKCGFSVPRPNDYADVAAKYRDRFTFDGVFEDINQPDPEFDDDSDDETE
ncbi:MAG: hypothetical protein MHM6MM_002272 [Cercozoa sp. M6MM]